MAAFSEQFSQYNPRFFEGRGLFEVLANSMARDANLLIGVELSQEDLIGICRCIESALLMELPDEAVRRVDFRAEISVLECAIEDGVDLFGELELRPMPHEQLAAYALWKLTDLCSITKLTQPSQRLDANVLIAAASAALQIAASYFAGDLRERCLGLVAKIHVSEAARKRVRKRWKPRDQHMEWALALAPSIHGVSRAQAARQLADAVFDEFKTRYTDDIVDGWLKKDEWRPTADGVSTL